MINFYLKSAELDIRIIINQILFYFRKIPVLKWLAPGSSYKMSPIKKFFSFFSPLGLFVFDFIKGLISILITALIAFSLYYVLGKFFETEYKETLLRLVLVFFVLDFSNFYIRDEKDKALMFFNLFNINPKNIALANVLIKSFANKLAFTLAFIIVSINTGSSINVAVMIGFFSYLTYIISNAINTKLADLKRLNANSEINHGFIMLGFMLVFIIFIFYFNVKAEKLILNPIVFLTIFVSTIFATIYLVKFNNYTAILVEFSDSYSFITKENKQERLAKTIALKKEDLEKSKLHLKINLKGYKLLNEMFFQRHRRIILKPMVIKAFILSVLLLILAVLPVLPIAELQAKLPKDYSKKLIEILPAYIPFAAYIIFNSETLTRIFFVNCDQALMQYGFYRRPKDLLKMFSLRLKKLLLWNSLSLLPMMLFLITMFIFYKVTLTNSIIVGIQYLALWVFFSVHSLFVYYIFQPYNDAQELKHPIYTIINILVYYVCYFSMQLKPKGPLVAPIFIMASILYSIIAIICIYTLAPKTFKVRIRKE